MILPDVNVLVYAFRSDMPRHEDYRTWLESVVDDESAFGISDLVASGFVRVVTPPRAFAPPSLVDKALAFVEALKGQPNSVSILPGTRHWGIFSQLCRAVNAKE